MASLDEKKVSEQFLIVYFEINSIFIEIQNPTTISPDTTIANEDTNPTPFEFQIQLLLDPRSSEYKSAHKR